MTRFAALILSACTSVLPCETCPVEPARIAVDVCAWAPPVAAREDDLGEIELGPEPPRKP